jgi:hypothetical protein
MSTNCKDRLIALRFEIASFGGGFGERLAMTVKTKQKPEKTI